MRLRLVSYNIMSGGEGRADPLAETLLGRKPDIIGIHEASDNSVLRRLSDRLEMDFVVADGDGGSVALFSRYRIAQSANVSVIHDSTMPILDVSLQVNGQSLSTRVAHLTDPQEAARMAQVLAQVVPDVMLMSYEPPLGMRVVDGAIGPASGPTPVKTHVPVRQLDQVLVQRHLHLIESWVEQDRLAYYASDHLPGGVEIELSEHDRSRRD